MKKSASRKVAAPAQSETPTLPDLPDDLQRAMQQAVASGRWLIAVYRVEDGQVKLHRTARDFPPFDLDTAVRLLQENVQALKPGSK
jgi:hypothetical protein